MTQNFQPTPVMIYTHDSEPLQVATIEPASTLTLRVVTYIVVLFSCLFVDYTLWRIYEFFSSLSNTLNKFGN